ncbi:MAG: protoporphyrinogen oxidase [Acidobacteria bacterium CG_4_9_14_3_um_filter_49_7]|nr:MAG: protoporphyrinogen oxidase [Acidobacteria bacterium CG_4_9_14_3_um_filter_49_7]
MGGVLRIAVIGGGISGLGTAFVMGRRIPGAEIDVFEKNRTPGGTIASYRNDGFLMETGPNGFLSGKPTTLKIVDMLEQQETLLPANAKAEKRMIVKRGHLVTLPDTPLKFFTSSILSFGGKLRIMKEPFVHKKVGSEDETIADFGQRRLGEQAVTWMLDPMVSGVFAGNVDKLSLASCFPRIHELEMQYGSLIMAMLKLRSKKASPSGRLTSFENGMGQLIEMLALSGAFHLHAGSEVLEIRKEADGFHLDHGCGAYDAVVLAVPAYSLAEMTVPGLKDVREDLASVPYPPMAIVPFAVKKGVVDGFGFLIPSVEKSGILGALYSSGIFPNRGTDKYDLVTVMLGGDRHYEVRDMDQAMLVNAASEELAGFLKVERRELENIGLFKWRRAIPQYYTGHYRIVERMEAAAASVPGLFVTGNAFYGIGINDCTLAAFNTAERVQEFLTKEKE